jgi:hypothetical protein
MGSGIGGRQGRHVMAAPSTTTPRGGNRRWARLLLLPPFIAVLWVPFYNAVEPTLGGIPFFYWYQLLWVLISAVLVYVVYLAET